MKTVVLAHGIRQMTARTHMQPLADALEERGITTHFADYGYVLIPTSNQNAVRAIHNAVRPGEDLAAYSNSAWAAVQAARQGLRIRNLYLISPALNVDTEFPDTIENVTVFYTPGDRVTTKGRLWRQATRILPWRWRNPHGWGEMGTKGPRSSDQRVKAIRIPEEAGHGWFKHPQSIEIIANHIEVTA